MDQQVNQGMGQKVLSKPVSTSQGTSNTGSTGTTLKLPVYLYPGNRAARKSGSRGPDQVRMRINQVHEKAGSTETWSES
jgi:hypothetical protein